MLSFGLYLRKLRENEKLTMVQLSEMSDYDIKTIYSIEHDHRRPSLTYLNTMSRLLNFNVISSIYMIENKNPINRKQHSAKLVPLQNTIRFLSTKNYYQIYRTSTSYGGCTYWVYEKGDDIFTMERRRLRPLCGAKLKQNIKDKVPYILNNEKEIYSFLAVGGDAYVETKIAEKYLPEYMEDFCLPPKNSLS